MTSTSDLTGLQQIMIIQTASAGDVILATPVIEKLHHFFPEAAIDFLLKDGNEGILAHHPKIREVIVWKKNRQKYATLFHLLKKIRKTRYDLVVNLQRFFSTGALTAFSGAGIRAGFDKNPLSMFFEIKIKHYLAAGIHETERNLSLIEPLTDNLRFPVKLYPTAEDFEKVASLKTLRYVCIAPASLWFTKQYPAERWIEFVQKIDQKTNIYYLGSKNDVEICNFIMERSNHSASLILAGGLSFLQTAALMKDAQMNFVNDSGPMHLASAMNAPVTVIYCSTVPEFGFGPLSEDAHIVQSEENLPCRPCGLHGHTQCPEKHFRCATTIEIQALINRLQQ